MQDLESKTQSIPMFHPLIIFSLAPIVLIGIISQHMGDAFLAPARAWLFDIGLVSQGGMQSRTLANTAAVIFSYIRLSTPFYFLGFIYVFKKDFQFYIKNLTPPNWKRFSLSLTLISGMLAFMVYITYFDGSNLESGRHIIRAAATNSILYSLLASCHAMMFYFIAHLTFISLIVQPIYLIKTR